PGVKFFKNLYPTNGGTIAFADVTTSDLRVNSWDIEHTPGLGLAYDADGDGVVDFTPYGNGNLWKITGGALVEQTGIPLTGGGNYINDIGDFDGDGDVDLRDTAWPNHAFLNTFNDVTIRTRLWNGSGYTVFSQPYAFPTGVPQVVIDDCLSRLKDPTLTES